jgi:hypothetical protein
VAGAQHFHLVLHTAIAALATTFLVGAALLTRAPGWVLTSSALLLVTLAGLARSHRTYQRLTLHAARVGVRRLQAASELAARATGDEADDDRAPAPPLPSPPDANARLFTALAELAGILSLIASATSLLTKV